VITWCERVLKIL